MVLDRTLRTIIKEIVEEVEAETGKKLTFESVLMAIDFQSRVAKFAIESGFDFSFLYLGKLKKKKRPSKPIVVADKVIKVKKRDRISKRITLSNGIVIRR